MPFPPKGEVAQWRIVYHMFRDLKVSEVVGYETLAEALGVDPETQRNRIQAAARKAGQHLLVQDNRTVEAILGQGYRVVEASRQIAMAGQQVERAVTSLDKGREMAVHVDTTSMNDVQVRQAQNLAVMLSKTAEWARQITQRVADHDDAIVDHSVRFADHEGRFAGIEAELALLRNARDEREARREIASGS